MPPLHADSHTITTKRLCSGSTPNSQDRWKTAQLLLWHGIFLLLVLAAISASTRPLQAVDYTWRWERIPQYIAYQAEQKHYAEFDGTVVVDKGQLFLQDDPAPAAVRPSHPKGSQLAEGGYRLPSAIPWMCN